VKSRIPEGGKMFIFRYLNNEKQSKELINEILKRMAPKFKLARIRGPYRKKVEPKENP
jgi:hypothetical protein